MVSDSVLPYKFLTELIHASALLALEELVSGPINASLRSTVNECSALCLAVL